MHDSRSHPLLEQVPLTVSPFVNLPRAATLPYRYKAMPSALPPSILEGGGSSGGNGNGTVSMEAGPAPSSAAATELTPTTASAKPAYVVSAASGTAAHPDDILASCRALREHVARMQADADAELQRLEERIAARDLAERRRVAPGWLDSDEHLLVPERHGDAQAAAAAGEAGDAATSTTATTTESNHSDQHATSSLCEMAAPSSAAEELQRTLGGLTL